MNPLRVKTCDMCSLKKRSIFFNKLDCIHKNKLYCKSCCNIINIYISNQGENESYNVCDICKKTKLVYNMVEKIRFNICDNCRNKVKIIRYSDIKINKGGL